MNKIDQAEGRSDITAERAVDPICGMTVDKHTAAGSLEYEGTTYYFCRQDCLEKFRKNPTGSLQPVPRLTGLTRTPKINARQYTCPMHPEIVRDHPGSCPICGMALELHTVSLEEEENPELVDMTRRFWISLTLSLPVFLIGMNDFVPGRPVERMISMAALGWIQTVLATPVVWWGGWPFFVRAWESLRNRSLNMFTLIGLGVSVAYVYSLVAKLFPGFFSCLVQANGSGAALLRGCGSDYDSGAVGAGDGARRTQ